MKGIILAGGSATRLYPLTKTISKQILPVYDKPMIYYPLSVLLMLGIRDILIISTSRDINFFTNLLGDGSFIGVNISYKIQYEPKGIADAFIVGKDFIQGEKVALILGDNIFYGHKLEEILNNASKFDDGAVLFGYQVNNPTAYGVVEIDHNGNALSIEEKPNYPKSNFAVPGLYFYDHHVVEFAESLTPSPRGEIEVTDINKIYLKRKMLKVVTLEKGIAWLDTGTPENLMEASSFVSNVQKRQGMYVSCIEEIAFLKGFISQEQLLKLSDGGNTAYAKYLKELIQNNQ